MLGRQDLERLQDCVVGVETMRDRQILCPRANTIRDPAGEVRRCCNVDNSFGFQGHPQDEFTGLVDMRSRWYWPFLGQFLAPDPIGFQGGRNLFAFVGSAQLGATDPFGLSAVATRAGTSSGWW